MKLSRRHKLILNNLNDQGQIFIRVTDSLNNEAQDLIDLEMIQDHAPEVVVINNQHGEKVEARCFAYRHLDWCPMTQSWNKEQA